MQLDDFSLLLLDDLFKSCRASLMILGWNYGLQFSKLSSFEKSFLFFSFSFKVRIIWECIL